MRQKDKKSKKVIEHIEMDVTDLDVVLIDKDGKCLPKPLLYVAINPEDSFCGAGFTAEDAIASLHEAYEEEE